MEKNLLLDEYWTDMFKSVYEHIKHVCDPEDYDNGWSRRGLIVADDIPSGIIWNYSSVQEREMSGQNDLTFVSYFNTLYRFWHCGTRSLNTGANA